MTQTLKLVITAMLAINLAACIYQPDIQQGNIYTQSQIAQLRLGMTKQQVTQVMGEPILNDTFEPNRWSYVYTYQKDGGKIEKKGITLTFKNNRLAEIN